MATRIDDVTNGHMTKRNPLRVYWYIDYKHALRIQGMAKHLLHQSTPILAPF